MDKLEFKVTHSDVTKIGLPMNLTIEGTIGNRALGFIRLTFTDFVDGDLATYTHYVQKFESGHNVICRIVEKVRDVLQKLADESNYRIRHHVVGFLSEDAYLSHLRNYLAEGYDLLRPKRELEMIYVPQNNK